MKNIIEHLIWIGMFLILSLLMLLTSPILIFLWVRNNDYSTCIVWYALLKEVIRDIQRDLR
jgi:hypothetical protein